MKVLPFEDHSHILCQTEVDGHARCARSGGVKKDDFADVGGGGQLKELPVRVG